MASLSMSNKGEVLQNSIVNETIQLTKTNRCDGWYCTLECSNFVLMRKSDSSYCNGLFCRYQTK